MIAGMNWLTTTPLIVDVISKLSELAMKALAERLLTIALSVCIVGGVSLFALTAFAWLWLKRAAAELHVPPSTARS